MNIVIPMAGMGTRMRPHTLLVPKPLLEIAGKCIVHRIVEDLKISSGKKIENIHFVIGNFGKKVEESLIEIAAKVGARGYIHYQQEALGTAHAVYCAREALIGETLIAFADTLFVGNFIIDDTDDCIIWTMKVKNPEQYGVVLTDEVNNIKGFVEKPKTFVSDKAIIGIYYFKNGELLRKDIEHLIDNNITKGGEFQLTDNLYNLFSQGLVFKSQEIDEWLDCGNKEEFLKSNKRILELSKFDKVNFKSSNSNISNKAYIGRNVEIVNSTINDFVSIADNCHINNSILEDCLIAIDTLIDQCDLSHSIVGRYSKLKKLNGSVNTGDYSDYENS